jgi:DNA replication protein DnaC
MVVYISGPPDVKSLQLLNSVHPSLLVIDDLMKEIMAQPDFLDLMSIHSHHSKYSTTSTYFNAMPKALTNLFSGYLLCLLYITTITLHHMGRVYFASVLIQVKGHFMIVQFLRLVV